MLYIPTDEVIDSILINDLVLDFNESGWVPRINEVIGRNKNCHFKVYKRYIGSKRNWNISNNNYTNQMVDIFQNRSPFREWLSVSYQMMKRI